MNYLLLTYVVIYTLVYSVLYLAEWKLVPPEEWDPPLERAFDLALVAVLLAGMLLLFFGVDSGGIKHMWKVASVAATAYAVVSNVRARQKSLQDPELASDHTTIGAADALSLVMLPAIAFNLFYAFWY